MKKEINIDKVRRDAEELYHTGGLYCSEAIVAAIRNNIDPGMPEAIVASASGFPLGVGGSKCMCGAVSGAVICLGYFFVRSHPSTITDPKSQRCMMLAHELQESFRNTHKSLCCHVHLRNIEMGSSEHKQQCGTFSGEMAAKTAEIIAREFELAVV